MDCSIDMTNYVLSKKLICISVEYSMVSVSALKKMRLGVPVYPLRYLIYDVCVCLQDHFLPQRDIFLLRRKPDYREHHRIRLYPCNLCHTQSTR